MKKFFTPILFILVSQLAGMIGSFFTASSVSGWYATLNKPSFNPPGWVFGPVWVTLYAMMGFSSYLIWLKRDLPMARFGLFLFFVHLLFNASWSIIFFGMKNPGLAFFNIIILFLMILTLAIIFYQINKNASYLLIPYLLWVSFASVLNFYIWRLN